MGDVAAFERRPLKSISNFSCLRRHCTNVSARHRYTACVWNSPVYLQWTLCNILQLLNISYIKSRRRQRDDSSWGPQAYLALDSAKSHLPFRENGGGLFVTSPRPHYSVATHTVIGLDSKNHFFITSGPLVYMDQRTERREHTLGSSCLQHLANHD